MIYLMLALSIIFEVIGTSLLAKTEEFRNIPFTLALLCCYGISFYLMSSVVKVLPVGIVYATWSATGIVLVSLAAYFFYNQVLDTAALIGISFIVIGVVIVNVFSKVSVH